LRDIPAFIWVTVPVAAWLAQHAVATLWGEVVKHLARRRTWLNALSKANTELKALKSALDQRDVQAAIERQLLEKMIVENDRLLLKLIVQSVDDTTDADITRPHEPAIKP
jgi:hypothetical protein